MKTWTDFFKVLFYYPGWTPNNEASSKASDDKQITKERTRKKYDPTLPVEKEIFIAGNFFSSLIIHQFLITNFTVSRNFP